MRLAHTKTQTIVANRLYQGAYFRQQYASQGQFR